MSRTVVASFVEVITVIIPVLASSSISRLPKEKIHALLVVILGLILLPFSPSFLPPEHKIFIQETEKLPDEEQKFQPISKNDVGVLPSLVGFCTIVLASALSSIRASLARKMAPEVGAKAMQATSIAAAVVLLFIPTVVQLFLNPQAMKQFFTGSFLAKTALIGFFHSVLNFYVTSFAASRIPASSSTMISYVSAVGASVLIYLLASSPPFLFLASVLLVGIGLWSFTASQTGSTLPFSRGVFSLTKKDIEFNEWHDEYDSIRENSTKDKSGKLWNTCRAMFSHVMSHSDSRKIFTFLTINFAFMFVELIVGILTNSLGLISDAGHMFFDCGALFIGLYASYISKLKADKVC